MSVWRRGEWAGRVIRLSSGKEAVELYRSSGQSLTVIARELGIALDTLRAWVKQADVDVGVREGLTTGEREELRELRQKVRRLEQEREILKRAVVLFAAETETR